MFCTCVLYALPTDIFARRVIVLEQLYANATDSIIITMPSCCIVTEKKIIIKPVRYYYLWFW